jgi:hypothetical protein
MNRAAPLTYGGKQMRLRCGAICLIALFVASSKQESNQERGASKHLAPAAPYTHLLTALAAHTFRAYDSLAETRGQAREVARAPSRRARARQDCPYGSQRNHSFLIVRFAVTLFPRARRLNCSYLL